MKLYFNVTVIFCIWAVSVLTIFYFSFSSLPHSDLFPHNFLRNLANWDGGHYLGIAENGYTTKSQYVFFPLYPILINLVAKITNDYLLSGLLISFISIFLALNILYRLILVDFGKFVAQKTLFFLLVFPLSFHFLTVYTESLFLLLAASSFLFLKQKKILLATLAAVLISATRLSGLAVAISLIASVYFTDGLTKKNWYVFFAPLGFLFYCLYLFNQTGDPLYFIQAESHFWKSGLALPGSAYLYSFKQLLIPGFIANNFRVLLDFLFTTFGIVAIFKIWKKLSLDYAIYSIISLLLPLFSPTIAAMPRYLLTIFPIFIILSFFKNQYLPVFYQFISLGLLSLYAILFLNGYWVS